MVGASDWRYIGGIMKTLKQIVRPYNAVLLVLFAGFLLPVSAQSQEPEPLIVKAKGHGILSSLVDERKTTAALVVLRHDGTVMITVTADIQLLAEGTWKASASSPEEILLRITGGVLKGEMIGSGKLLLTSDRKSIKELRIDVTTIDGREIMVIFIGDESEAPEKGQESQAPFRAWLWLDELEEECARGCRYDADQSVGQFNCTTCRYGLTACRVPAPEYAPTLYCK
jgi:hypothetical protein